MALFLLFFIHILPIGGFFWRDNTPTHIELNISFALKEKSELITIGLPLILSIHSNDTLNDIINKHAHLFNKKDSIEGCYRIHKKNSVLIPSNIFPTYKPWQQFLQEYPADFLAFTIRATPARSVVPANDYKLVKTNTRNIILVGKSRSGKSTIIEVLKNPKHNPEDFKILRGTVKARINSFTLSNSRNKKRMHLNIMDTPGLFERSSTINTTRSNEIITKMVLKCVDMELTKIHHVYYVMSIQQGISAEDVEAFRIFAELFVGMEDKISIILSFSQDKNPNKNQLIKDQFNEVPELRPIEKAVKGRIFFVGSAQNNGYVDLEKLQNNVANQREKWIEHIMAQHDTYNVKNLQIYKENLKLMVNLRQNLTSCCESKCVDLNGRDAFINHYSHGVEKLEEQCDVATTIMFIIILFSFILLLYRSVCLE
eukprot:298717_1